VRPIDWNLVSDDRGLALLTVPILSATGPMYLADFKDLRALAFKKTRNFIGLSRNRGVRLGGYPLNMVDGIWYVTEDLEAKVQDLQISHEMLCLQLIR
jgi:hypothetical protein